MFFSFGQRASWRRALAPACAALLALGTSVAAETQRPPRFTTDAESRSAAPELRPGLQERPVRAEWGSKTGQAALTFARDAFARLAHEWKVPLAEDASRALRFELSAQRVEERPESVGATYVASVTLTLALTTEGDRVLWKGKARGSSSRFGRAGHRELANLTLSDAFAEALAALLGQDALQEAWVSKRVESPPEPLPQEAVRAPETETQVVKKPADEDLDRVSPETLLSDLVALIEAGFEDANLLDVVKSKALTRAFTEKDVAAWRASGIPESVLEAARRRPR